MSESGAPHRACSILSLALRTYCRHLNLMKHTDIITDYHVHVYFDDATVDQARAFCEDARDRFGVTMGRVHERPVGPHPMYSCLLGATPEQFNKLLPWCALNRNGLIIFAHPSTGDDLADHRDHAIWLGAGLELKLSMFENA